MKLFHCIQGESEWINLRLGIPTGSEIDRIITPGGKPTGDTVSEKYMLELLAQRITGQDESDFQSKWMERGKTLESDAVRFYELQRDMDTVPVGFIKSDDETVGVSPDRLVGNDGMMEIKCPKSGIHLGYLLKSGAAYEKYKCQVQCELWVAERIWNDTVSYNPVMPMALFRAERDDVFIGKMAKLVGEFNERLQQKEYELSQLGWMPKGRGVSAPVFSKEVDLAFEAWNARASN